MKKQCFHNRDWLWEHYIVREESTPTMAREAQCVPSTIYCWLRKNGIPTRGCGEGSFLAKRNSAIITPDLLEFMEGEILGDGNTRMNSDHSALYQHTSKYREYLTWLSEYLNEWGIGQVGKITKYKDKRTGVISYHYASQSYPELVPIYKHWYPDGKKTVPEDLRLTPIMARQWYLGDGGLTDYKIKRPGIQLCTCDFNKQSIDYLIEELNGLGFKTTYQPSHNSIRIWVRSVPNFLSWIGPCPISCYDYKWDYSDISTK